MDTKKLKKLNNLLAIGSFVCFGICAIFVLLTWLFGTNIYSSYINTLPEDQKAGQALGLILIIIIWIPCSIALGVDGIVQLIFGINCVKTKKMDKTHRRAATLIGLCVLDVLGLAGAFLIAGTLEFMKFPIFMILAVILALDTVYKLVLAIYIFKAKKQLYAVTSAEISSEVSTDVSDEK